MGKEHEYNEKNNQGYCENSIPQILYKLKKHMPKIDRLKNID